MTSTILIPTYLWKNTFKRWQENPISPLSKIIITYLLCLFAILILVSFQQVKKTWLKQLQENNSLHIELNEFVEGNDASSYLPTFVEESKIWPYYFTDSKIDFYFQPNIRAQTSRGKYVRTLVALNHHDILSPNPSEGPQAVLLKEDIQPENTFEEVTLNNHSITVRCVPMPEILSSLSYGTELLLLDYDMTQSFTNVSFTSHIFAQLNSIEDVEKFAALSSAYYKAERRTLKTNSSLPILRQIKNLNSIQDYIRSGLVLGCGFILSIIIASIACLEVYQERYLFALLKSFGIPNFVLFFHIIFENFLAILIGLLLSFVSWKEIYDKLLSIPNIPIPLARDATLSFSDFSTVILFCLVSVILASSPAISTLRKPAGLTLQ